MMTPVISGWGWIVVVPAAIVDWDSHFLGIAIVVALRAAIVFISPIILWIVNVGVVIETVVILCGVVTAPNCPVRMLLSLGGIGRRAAPNESGSEYRSQNDSTNHGSNPSWLNFHSSEGRLGGSGSTPSGGLGLLREIGTTGLPSPFLQPNSGYRIWAEFTASVSRWLTY